MAFGVGGRRNVGEWISLIKGANSEFCAKLDQIYGDNKDLKAEAARMCLQCLDEFNDRYDAPGKVIIVRSTGRVNLLFRIDIFQQDPVVIARLDYQPHFFDTDGIDGPAAVVDMSA